MKKFKFIIFTVFFVAINIQACEEGELYPEKMFLEVKISTNFGDIVVELNRNRAPITVNNFLKYVKKETYNNTIIHRVEKDFVIQGGGYNKQHELIDNCGKIFNESGNGLKNSTGSIAMARYEDPHSATSQFYFNLNENTSLDPNSKNWGYTVFGEVIEGMEVLEEISNVKTRYHEHFDSTSFPLDSIIIKSVELE
jgi:peptidyl-prolyl cis-trans isomerase A (cyclophilin A)